MRAIGGSLSFTIFTGYIYGIPTLATTFTKIIDFPNIGTITINNDNLIDSPLFENIQVIPIYEDQQMDIKGSFIPNMPLQYIDITHPFTSSLASLQRMIIRQNASVSPYLFDYRTQLIWHQDIQNVIANN